MQTAAKKSRFLTLISSKERFDLKNPPRFYQQMAVRLTGNLSFAESVTRLGGSLMNVAEHAYYLRRKDLLSEAIELLDVLPLSQSNQTIALYHKALSLIQRGNRAQACVLFERVVSKGSDDYKARAMAALGFHQAIQGNLESATALTHEAIIAASRTVDKGPLNIAIANQNMAFVRSLAGDHRGSLRQLKEAFPIARLTWHQYPEFYFSYLNSLAVEHGEVGEVAEASNICNMTLASPFARAYPEWRETADEIALKVPRRSSTVALTRLVANVQTRNVFPISNDRNTSTSFPEPSRRLPEQQARVLSFTNWKTQMSREPLAKPKPRVSLGQMTRKQKIIRIVDLVCNEISDEQLDNILEAVERIAPDEKVKD